MFKKIIDTITDSLRVKNNEIIGNIYNLEKKLNGEIPVTRLELLTLVSSWGRNGIFYTNIKDDKVFIKEKNKGKSFDLSKLDVSKITNMDYIFKCSLFTGDISKWDVSKVTSMKEMFYEADKFNGDIGNWDTSNVTDMNSMFSYAYKFNNNIGKWEVSNVTSMCGMFDEAENFNQNISNWNVSNVTSMEYMFYYTESFNQNISKWNLDNIKNCDYMFDNAKEFLGKYNSGEPLPKHTDEIKKWFNLNGDKMNEIDIKDQHGVELDNFFSNILLKECNKPSNRMQQVTSYL